MTSGPETSDEGQVIFSKSGNLEKTIKFDPPETDIGSHDVVDLCKASCDRRDINYEIVDRPDGLPVRALLMNFRGESHTYRCVLEAHEELEQVIFYVITPENVPPEKRTQVMEFITRANYGIRIGNFEMDIEDGEVRYKTSLDIEHASPTPAIIDNIMGISLTTMDRYFEGILRVVYGNIEPKEAIDAIEK